MRENLDPLRQKPDFDNKYQEWINARFYHATRGDEEWPDDEETFIAGCEHVWTSHVEPLIADRDKFAIGFAEFISKTFRCDGDLYWKWDTNRNHAHTREQAFELYKESLLNQKL